MISNRTYKRQKKEVLKKMNNSPQNIVTVICIAITTIIAAIIIFYIIIKIVEGFSEYNKAEKQTTIKQRPEEQQQPNEQYQQILPYRLNMSVLTPSEGAVYDILNIFCQKHKLILLSKIRIADFVITDTRTNYYKWFNRISAKHVDYLICDYRTYAPLLAIELDDYTHNWQKRKERDDFINQVYYSIRLPIIHLTYINENEIIKQVSEVLKIDPST